MPKTKAMNAFDVIGETVNEKEKETEKISFKEMFPYEDKKLQDIESTYAQTIANATSKKERDAAKKELQSCVKRAADDLLRKDKSMQLRFPFKLEKDSVDKITANPKYYLNDGIITKTHRKGRCWVCGKKSCVGDIFVVIEGDGTKMWCIGCADNNITIDGAGSYIVQSV